MLICAIIVVSRIDSYSMPEQIGLGESTQESFSNYYLPVNNSSIMNNQVFNMDVKISDCFPSPDGAESGAQTFMNAEVFPLGELGSRTSSFPNIHVN